MDNTTIMSCVVIMDKNGNNIDDCGIFDTIYCSTNEHINIPYKETTLKFIAIQLDKKQNLQDIHDIHIYIGYNLIWKLSFNMLCKLSKITYDDDNCYITFHDDMFDTIPVASIPFHPVQFRINSKKQIKYELHLEYRYIKYQKPLDNVCIPITQYHESGINHLETHIVPNDIRNFTGFFIETTKIKNLTIKLDGITVIKYNQYVLNSNMVAKDIWTKRKSVVFNIIMEKIMPYEIIDHIEKYICDTYLYYVPINIDNKKWFSKDNKYIPVRGKRMLIDLHEPKIADICFISHNKYHILGGCINIY